MPQNMLDGGQVIVDYLVREKVPYVVGLCGQVDSHRGEPFPGLADGGEHELLAVGVPHDKALVRGGVEHLHGALHQMPPLTA